jgi:mRNA-degrading endonuclease toxin of MazEF toxin-antitoxin module
VTLVVPITSRIRLPLSPLHVLLPAGPSTGLPVASVAAFNQIRALDRKRLVRKLGEIDALAMAQAERAIQDAFGLDLEPAPVITRAIAESTAEFKTGRYDALL